MTILTAKYFDFYVKSCHVTSIVASNLRAYKFNPYKKSFGFNPVNFTKLEFCVKF